MLLLAASVLVACAPTERKALGQERHYACDFGDEFTALFTKGQVEIETGATRHRLAYLRTSVIGERYGTGEVAFIRDGVSGVLVGADNGRYRNCVEVDAAREPRGAG